MRKAIFQFQSYRAYLKDVLEALGPKSGLKKRAAEALEVHTTFISQVVLGKADLSLDQGEKMNSFLKHNEVEAGYFIDLIIYERAVDRGLKSRYEIKLRKWQNEASQIKFRINPTSQISESDQRKFYSSHLFGLLHVLASIPKYQNKKSLMAATGYPPEIVEEAVDFLIQIGVLKILKDCIVPGEKHVHLGRDSKFINQHHSNWRIATAEQLAFSRPEDLHYSLTFSCSEKDSIKITESLLEHLKSMTQTIEKSKEENVYVYCFDFFRWG